MKRILNCAKIYEFYQWLVGSPRLLELLKNEYIKVEEGMRFLDIGCGTANILKHLPQNIEYTGIDIAPKYIEYNKRKYPTQTFICESVEKEINFDKAFDIVYSEAIISALNDEQTVKLLKLICSASNPNTRIIIADMNYDEKACLLQKFLQRNERNSFLRSKDDYIKLISPYLKIKKVSVIEKVMRIPYSTVVLECSLKN